MTREERQALLHDGTGPATMSAFVEIIFDNTDNRFPTGKDEVILRRTIGLKKDEYSLDRKSVPKSEVMSLLESAGFSRSNPYYIVPQGRVTSLCNAKDAERLQVLKEVAGTRVYEQRRIESLKIMDETDLKRRKIEELLKYIEERLTELEEEKEELKLFYELDKDRRSVEYTIYQREQSDVNEQLEELEEDRRLEIDGSHQRRIHAQERERVIDELQMQLNDSQQKIDVLNAEREQIRKDYDDLMKQKAHLEIELKDLEDSSKSSFGEMEKLSKELERVDKLIEKRESDLRKLEPDYVSKTDQEKSLEIRVQEASQKLQYLVSKQGRISMYKTKRDRDNHLKKEIQSLKKNLDVQNKHAESLSKKLANGSRKVKELDSAVRKTQSQIETEKLQLQKINKSWKEQKKARDQLYETRKEFWRKDAQYDAASGGLKEEVKKSERALKSMIDRGTSSGLESVKNIAKRLKLTGVHGPLYELFEVEQVYSGAVEITAGQSLFHVVVDNDEIVTKILDVLNREKSGRVTFMPLNRLKPKPVAYPDSSDAVPMISKLKFNPKFKVAMEQVFGKTVICPTLEAAAQFSKANNLNAITLDGDRVERKGALTGGYHDSHRSRLDAIKQLKSAQEKFQKEKKMSEELKEKLEAVESQCLNAQSELSSLDNQRKRLSRNQQPLTTGLNGKKKDFKYQENLVAKTEKLVETAKIEISTTEKQIQALLEEMRLPLEDRLTADEAKTLEKLSKTVPKLKEQLSEISSERALIETEKVKLQNELELNLKRKRLEIQSRLEKSAGKELNSSQESQDYMDDENENVEIRRTKSELGKITKNSDDASKQLVEIDKAVENAQGEIRKIQSTIDTNQNEQQEDLRFIENMQKHAERYLSKRGILIAKKNECSQKIIEIGAIPEEAFEKYREVSTNKLVKNLHKTNEQLKKYGHVNKKAFEQYNNFTKQRESLLNRKDELDQSATSIQELIMVLDQRKDEAIERTFRQVAKNFEWVFKKLVPSGHGQLVMQRRIDEDSDLQNTQTNGDGQFNRDVIESYTGVSIKVSFTTSPVSTGTEEPFDESQLLLMQQLSGGQKSLVALAMIFSIQLCDPAPFYLFDEIDANLDAAYRSSVASMIHEFSNGGMDKRAEEEDERSDNQLKTVQFITTTFRPELLQHADKFYGVTFRDRVSNINVITAQDALLFVEQGAQA